MISGILAGGIPGFRIELCCFLHPAVAHGDFVGFSRCYFVLWACEYDTKVVICMRRDDTKLSPLASTDLFHP